MTNQELEQAIVWGGYYKNKHSLWDNEQSYHTSVPIRGKDDEIWMIDTYVLSRPSTKEGQTATNAMIEKICNQYAKEDCSYTINKAKYGFYHQNEMKLNSVDSLKGNFELICDLNNYRGFEKGENYEDYEEEDVIPHVRLFREHGFDWNLGAIGVRIVKKNADTSYERIFKKCLNETWRSWELPSMVSSYNYDRTESALNACYKAGIKPNPRDLNRLEQLKYLKLRLKYMCDEISKYLSDTKYKYDYKFVRDSKTTLGDIPGVEHYLATKCYCPNEVYSLAGFGYELFYTSNKIKIFNKGKLGYAAFAQGSEDSYPEILFIQVDFDEENIEDRIITIVRVDVTDKNIENMEIAVNEKSKLHFTSYNSKTRDNDIDSLINLFEEVEI